MAISFAVSAATAQDLPTDQLERHGEVVMHGVLLDKTIDRGRTTVRQSRGDGYGSRAHARATCQNKGRAAANLEIDHPKVRQLYRLCAQAGF